MSEQMKAIVVGVGPEDGLGGALCKRLSQKGCHVFAVGRTAEKVETLAHKIISEGGRATAVAADTTKEQEVLRLFERADQEVSGPLGLVIYNAGNARGGQLHEMETAAFEDAWRVGCLGGFLVGREAVRRMLPQARGTVIFTGATASLRGKQNTTAFASSKAALRSLAQSMARGYGPQGIHVAHVIVDGGIAGERIKKGNPQYVQSMGEDGLISLDGLADVYWFLHTQPRAAWTHELDLRTYKEPF